MEVGKLSNEYKVVSEFCCHGTNMITVRIGSTAHIMSKEEWGEICQNRLRNE